MEKSEVFRPSRRLMRVVERFIHRNRLFRGGDAVAAGVSGGKDSSLMLYLLAHLRETIRGGFHLEAFFVSDPASPCFAGADLGEYENWCRQLNVPLHVLQPVVPPDIRQTGKPVSPCFRCSWRRRETLFKAIHTAGFRILALGHTGFDAATTALINLCRHGKLETMPPSLSFFQGKIRVIRPLMILDENEVIRWVERLKIPLVEQPCRADIAKTRKRTEEILRNLQEDHPPVIKNIISAATPFEPPAEP